MYPSRSMNLASFFCLCFILVLFGCGGGGGGGGDGDVPPPANLPPVVDAGQDQFAYTSDQVILTGVSSDDDGTVVSHQWTQTAGPEVDFSGATTSTLIFTPLTETASYTFEYTATDDDGAEQSDTVSVYASKILFSDSFDDNSSLSNWMLENDTVYLADWDVLNGELFQNNSVDVQSFLASYHLGTFRYLNGSVFSVRDQYRFSVDVLPRPNVTTREGNDVGILFAYTDATHYYRLSMNARYGFTRLEKRQGATFETLAVNSIGYIDDQPMTLMVEVSGDTIMVFIDGEPVFAESNLTDLTGTVALYSQDKVSFDNVVIADNSLQPMVAVSSPLAHTIALGAADGDTLAVEAVALNPPADGNVVLTLFNLDVGMETDSMVATESGGNLYSAQFLAVDNGEYEISAVLNDAANAALNADINTVVGVGGDYIIAVGDSIINGVKDEDPSNNDSADGRIVAIQGSAAPLDDSLTATLDLPHIVFNEGLPADRSTWLVGDRIDSKMERHPGADTMLLLIGTNDSSVGTSGTPADDFEDSVRAVATAALVAGVDRVYIARIPPRYDNDSATNAVNNSRITIYNNRIFQIATEFSDDKVFLGPDFYTLFEDQQGLLYDLDGLHPNDAGYQAMADAWHNTLTTTP